METFCVILYGGISCVLGGMFFMTCLEMVGRLRLKSNDRPCYEARKPEETICGGDPN